MLPERIIGDDLNIQRKGRRRQDLCRYKHSLCFKKKYKDVSCYDCDVEELNGHLFIKPYFKRKEDINMSGRILKNVLFAVNAPESALTMR